MADEKKDAVDQEKGDKGHDAEKKESEQEEHSPGQKAGSTRGGHRRRTGGNPDASN